MSIQIDLLIPSFSVPFASGNISTVADLGSFKEHEHQNLLDQCAKAFDVDGNDIQIFKMINNKMDVRIGCFITGYSMLPPPITPYDVSTRNITQHAVSRSITQHHAASRSITQHHAVSRSTTQHHHPVSYNTTPLHAAPRSTTQHHAVQHTGHTRRHASSTSSEDVVIS